MEANEDTHVSINYFLYYEWSFRGGLESINFTLAWQKNLALTNCTEEKYKSMLVCEESMTKQREQKVQFVFL